MRANIKITVRRDSSGLSEILSAVRMYRSAKGKSGYEKQVGGEPNTNKKLAINPFRYISKHQTMQLEENDFESTQDSTILVRERSRGTK